MTKSLWACVDGCGRKKVYRSTNRPEYKYDSIWLADDGVVIEKEGAATNLACEGMEKVTCRKIITLDIINSIVEYDGQHLAVKETLPMTIQPNAIEQIQRLSTEFDFLSNELFFSAENLLGKELGDMAMEDILEEAVVKANHSLALLKLAVDYCRAAVNIAHGREIQPKE